MEFRFHLRRSKIDEKLVAYYDPDSETVNIFLPVISEKYKNDDEMIKAIISTIVHETFHHAFKVCMGKGDEKRVELEHKIMKKIGTY